MLHTWPDFPRINPFLLDEKSNPPRLTFKKNVIVFLSRAACRCFRGSHLGALHSPLQRQVGRVAVRCRNGPRRGWARRPRHVECVLREVRPPGNPRGPRVHRVLRQGVPCFSVVVPPVFFFFSLLVHTTVRANTYSDEDPAGTILKSLGSNYGSTRFVLCQCVSIFHVFSAASARWTRHTYTYFAVAPPRRFTSSSSSSSSPPSPKTVR